MSISANISAPFVKRPVATTLITLAIMLVGILAFQLLPVSPLPQVDFPTISVNARQPGASPETMASTVATPLERALGRIAGVNEITSNSSLGSSRITLQFDLNRDINGAARDVQAAINASRSNLPSMPSNPSYRKMNPADAPIVVLGLTSDSLTPSQMYDSADSVIAQKLLQIEGVGDVNVGGGAQPAVRVAVNPNQLNHFNLDLETVRTTLSNANNNRPKGAIKDGNQIWQIQTNDQLSQAKDYFPLIVSYQNGDAIRLSDIATITDSSLNARNAGMVKGEPAIMLIITRQPGANIIATVDRIKQALPQIQKEIPAGIKMQLVVDRSPTIRASLHDVEQTLVLSVALVVLVVLLFLRNLRATLIPAITVPVSLIGTFAVMYVLGFSLNNLSLMALTIATGFVVDDTVVVLENISRHLENGLSPVQAAIVGTQEVGFTVVAMSLSLIAVFVPILLMGGIVGRLLHEFAVTLSTAIILSLFVSLTTTPMLCSRWLKTTDLHKKPSKISAFLGSILDKISHGYSRSLAWALQHRWIMLLTLLITVGLNGLLFTLVSKGFFPQQDTGLMMANIQADQSTSFQSMRQKLETNMRIIADDKAVASVAGFTGGGSSNSANMFVSLKPLEERQESADAVIQRLRQKLSKQPGADTFLQSVQDIRMGGRQTNAQYQYSLQGDDLETLKTWTPKVVEALQKIEGITQVNSDVNAKGLDIKLNFDRDAMAQLGVTQASVDNILNDAFGQRQVSNIYKALNQYHVVMEVPKEFNQSPVDLSQIYVKNKQGQPVALSAIATWQQSTSALSVNHQSGFAATTLSFNLQPGVSLSDVTDKVQSAVNQVGMPSSITGSFQGTAQTFQSSFSTMPALVLLAIFAVYVVLGVLYESLIHPVTILSTLPSAGVGAFLALIIFKSEFDVISFIGILLLIGIVKKNAIMMVDFALAAERNQHLSPYEAIFQACILRFRPIMMTTLAALLGALPLAIAHGNGTELRTPLGISIVGGLIVSQVLTLYTTPVMYLLFDTMRVKWLNRRQKVQFAES